MKDAGLVISGVIAAGMVLVVLPVAAATFLRLRPRKSVLCPQTGRVAGIRVNALEAALASTFDRLPLKVKECSLWPEKGGCAQECLRGVEHGRDTALGAG